MVPSGARDFAARLAELPERLISTRITNAVNDSPSGKVPFPEEGGFSSRNFSASRRCLKVAYAVKIRYVRLILILTAVPSIFERVVGK